MSFGGVQEEQVSWRVCAHLCRQLCQGGRAFGGKDGCIDDVGHGGPGRLRFGQAAFIQGHRSGHAVLFHREQGSPRKSDKQVDPGDQQLLPQYRHFPGRA